jgi:uncharacterized protein
MARFRILSLDGGGVWSLLQVMALKDRFGAATTGHAVLRQFDLVAANSGGALVLGGLTENMTLGALFDLFASPTKNLRDRIFVKTSFFADPLSHLTRLVGIGPQYDAAAKLAGIRSILQTSGDKRLVELPDFVGEGESGRKPQFLLCGFQYDLTRVAFFRSDAESLAGSFGPAAPTSLAEAIHASANPPVNYFNAPATFGRERYWDGGIAGYNNPVLAAAIEAVANAQRYGTAVGEIEALSLGTGSVVLPLARGAADEDPDLVQAEPKLGLFGDLRKLAGSILDDPPDAASFHAHLLLGGALPTAPTTPVTNGPIERLSPLVQPVWDDARRAWRLPPGLSREQFRALRTLDMAAVAQNAIELIEALGDAWLANKVPNQPIRANRETLAVEIGRRWYR